MSTEEWRRVAGYPDYEVSNTGFVRSYKQSASMPRILKPMMTGLKRKQYQTVTLAHAGVTRTCKVHVLVLETFVGPKPPGAIGCHADDNANNNHVTNLYWGDYSKNARDRVRNNKHAGQRLTTDQVVEIRKRRLAGERGCDLAKEFGVPQQIIWNIYSGRTGGYLHGE